MWAQVKDNEVMRVYAYPVEVEVNGVRHPSSIFSKWSASDLKGIGIYPYSVNSVEGHYHNTGELSYTINADDVVGKYTVTDKDVALVKARMIQTSRNMASELLSRHDWMAIREMEGGEAMPADVKTYRAAVRTESNNKEAEINALADMDAIKAYEKTSFTSVTKVWDDAAEDYGSDTKTTTAYMNMTNYYVAVDPTAEVHPAFVSLTKD